MFEIRKRKFVVFQNVNKRICLLPGNCFVVQDDLLKGDIHKPSLVEAKACENVREKLH